MIDREQLEAVLMHRFPGTALSEIAAAANAIMALSTSTPREGLLRQPGVGCPQPKTGSDVEAIVQPRSSPLAT